MQGRRLGRLPYLALGTGLFAIESILDWQVSRAYREPYSLLFCVSPMDAPLFRASETSAYWRALFCVAIPFFVALCFLTVRRLRDAGLPSRWVVLFFFPFVNHLFFAAMAAVSAQEPPSAPPVPRQSVYREGRSVDTRLVQRERSNVACALLAGSLGAVVGLGAMDLGIGVIRQYATALLLGAPVISGFATGGFYARVRPWGRFSGAALGMIVALGLTFGVAAFFPFEGLGCLLAGFPFFWVVTLFATYMGYAIAKSTARTAEAAVSPNSGLY
jgi:uncharacterized membrane protein YhaH (DUF805 family)